MTSTNDISESASNEETDEVEIKMECPEINIVEESTNKNTIMWTSKATSCLIAQYKKYRSMVGQTTQFRSLRDMFETISVEMQKHGFHFSPQRCENKWRVLERKYKNLMVREMLKKPGRMKHYGHWEHKRALDEIFNEKRKSVYLRENEYPSIGGSTKYALILPKLISEQSNGQTLNETIQKLRKNIDKSTTTSETEINEDLSEATSKITVTKTLEELLKEPIAAYFEKFLVQIKECFDIAEKNKERRHLENMVMRQSELKIQEKLLKLKEQKLELKKRQILAMAQNIQLNI